ncbi:hypothetical protein F5X96DRAFT_571418 [Biscogniauxia mediterranea]|nr:hypothetical protein F5X96DRAFT_571418 [Biscogniauxia mediterranea]
MPTIQVSSTDSTLLQNVADVLGKARKMVIITGAGISTNSGIPDFRSENGLYSLIQEQFERAEASSRNEPDHVAVNFGIAERPAKRRRISHSDQDMPPKDEPTVNTDSSAALEREESDPAVSQSKYATDAQNHGPHIPEGDAPTSQPVTPQGGPLSRRTTRSRKTALRPPFPRHLTGDSSQSSTSQGSVFSAPQFSGESSQSEDSTAGSAPQSRGPQTRSNTPNKLLLAETFSSSPLSSPPPVLFDPYENLHTTDSSSQGNSDCSETSEASDTECTQQSVDLFSSQSSGLRNMKGRDLFDCNIWADPLKTSVFYRFATSLRQRVREVEPTTTHRFIARMRDVGKLARVYTQNIDEIEKKIGLSTDLKNGAGTKRRRPNKQSPTETGKDGKENADPLKSEEDPGGSVSAPASQDPEDNTDNTTRSKPRPSLVQDRGVECVFLHGSLHALRCFVCGKLCDWDEDGRELCTLSGEQPECPHCAGATAARQEKGKRALGVGKLRPDIVLYGEEHPQSDLISPIVQHDLSTGPDLLLVLGTSLRVHGLKVMVKEFAKAVHNKGGKVVFINFTKPSESVWGDIIDYWIEWDCDAWVEDLKDRRPQLWLSPEELVELEKQRREAIAEKKREISKKRESLIEKKRESLESKRRHTIELSKLRPPPKNPSAMRNDYQCGAYVVWEIFQTLAKIGDRPFDNLGHTPPAPAPAPSCLEPQSSVVSGSEPRPKAKIKRPRKSAPAALAIVAMENAAIATTKAQATGKTVTPAAEASTAAPTASTTLSPKPKLSKPPTKARPSTKHDGKDQYAKAAKGLARAGKPPTPARLASLCRSPVPPPSVPVPAPVSVPMPVKKEEASIVAAVKTHPRRRKRKVIDGVEVGLPAAPTITRPRPSLPLPTPTPNNVRTDCRHRTTEFPVVANTTLSPRGPMLPPLHSNWEQSPPAIIEPMEPNPVVSPQSPLVEIRPHVWQYNSYAMHPMLYSDPLVGLQYQMNYQRPLREATTKHSEDKTPSPSDQLRREWEIAYELSRMRDRL